MKPVKLLAAQLFATAIHVTRSVLVVRKSKIRLLFLGDLASIKSISSYRDVSKNRNGGRHFSYLNTQRTKGRTQLSQTTTYASNPEKLLAIGLRFHVPHLKLPDARHSSSGSSTGGETATITQSWRVSRVSLEPSFLWCSGTFPSRLIISRYTSSVY